jgi:hypothetical protein
MKRLALALTLIIASKGAVAAVDYVTAKECRSFIFGKAAEADTQDRLNQDLKTKLNALNVSKVDFIQYGNQQDIFRDGKNACIIATAWFHK